MAKATRQRLIKTPKCSEGHSLTFYCRPTVVLSFLFFFLFNGFFLNLLRVEYFINNFPILLKDSSVCTFLSSLLQ